MALGEVYGAPSGIIMVDQDLRDAAVTQMTLQQQGVKLAQAQMELGQQQNFTRMWNDRQQKRNQQLATSAQGGQNNQSPDLNLPSGKSAQSSPFDTVEALTEVADMKLAAGQVDEAEKYITAASNLRKSSAAVDSTVLDSHITRLNVMANLMNGVDDSQSWAKANAVYTQEMGEPSPWARYQYSPDLVEKIRDGVVSQKDKAVIDADKSRGMASRAQVIEDAARTRLLNAQTQMTKDRDAQLAKAGGKPIAKSEIDEAVSRLRIDYDKDAIPGEQAKWVGRQIAERARDIQKENPSLKQSEATEQSYQEARQSGMLKDLNPSPKPKDKAIELIDSLIRRANQSRRELQGVTGVGGFVARVEEDVGNKLGITDDTKANDFASDLNALRLMSPKLLTGTSKSAKDERQAMQDVIRGLGPGSTAQNTASSLNELRKMLTGQGSPDFRGKDTDPKGRVRTKTPAARAKASDEKFTVDQVYTDAKGNKAKYLGEGKWQPM